MTEVKYKISTYPSKWQGYQSKKGMDGVVRVSIDNLWVCAVANSIRTKREPFDLFVEYIITIFNHERFCLERAFQKIRIKGGMCNPCCIRDINAFTTRYLFNYGEGVDNPYE